MSAQSDRQAARAAVAAYHEVELAVLVQRVATAIDRFRDGELDAVDVDRILFRYSRAAKVLWEFCNVGGTGLAAKIVRQGPAVDWWQRGAPRTRFDPCRLARGLSAGP